MCEGQNLLENLPLRADKSPREYVERLGISEERLAGHFINIHLLKENKFEEFLNERQDILKEHIQKLVTGGLKE